MNPGLRQLLFKGPGLRARNLLATSNRPQSVNSVTTPAPSYESESDPGGSKRAWKYAVGTTGFCQGNLTLPADVRPYVYTMRAKALSAGARIYLTNFGINAVTGQQNSAANSYYDFDSNTFGAGVTDWYAEADGNGFIKLRRLFVNSGAGVIFAHRIDAEATYTNGMVAVAWHQLEEGNTPTEYDETGSRAVGIANTFTLARSVSTWGDSLTAGTGDDAGFGYPRRVNAARKLNYHNGGVGGETSTQIKTRVLADALGRNSWVNVFWLGRNNVADPTTVKADIASCVGNLYAGNSRYLVCSVLTSADDTTETKTTISTLNSDLSSLYGSRYVDVLGYLQAFGDGSANDNADIAASLVPRSLRSDAVHLNPTGYQHVANCINARLDQLGW